MKNIIITLLMIAGITTALTAVGNSEPEAMEPVEKMEMSMNGSETAIFAGGCFWGIEGVFELLEGVENVVSGYSGGPADMAHYNMVGSGQTGHAEAVQIDYDPQMISYEKLLEVFFHVAHDPTQLNYQGPDVGTEYRSAIFYANDEQKMKTEIYIKELEKQNVYQQPIVTQLEELDAFYPAENYHQDYLRRNPNQPYIVYWDMPKIKDLESRYPELLQK